MPRMRGVNQLAHGEAVCTQVLDEGKEEIDMFVWSFIYWVNTSQISPPKKCLCWKGESGKEGSWRYCTDGTGSW
jgi:hypothetical protein